MQSIWYGRQEKLFGSEEERQVLLAYTKEAIDFAAAVGCGNLVFGCPRNRNVPEGIRPEQVEEIACGFFHELGEYAYSKGTALSIERTRLFTTPITSTIPGPLWIWLKKWDPGDFCSIWMWEPWWLAAKRPLCWREERI